MTKRSLHSAVILLLGIFLSAVNVQSSTEKLKKDTFDLIDTISHQIVEASDAIWGYAETALLEEKSSKLLADIAEREGFTVERGVADLSTAFVASYGSGRPIIGILAEYDALPGLSQDAISYKKVLIEGEPGHGCGHNLFGAASLGAALAVKKLIEEHKLSGTVRLYGCPAEEDVGGKLYMARAGLFNDLDASLAWHPSYETQVDVDGSQAIDDMEIEFFGKAAHAAFDPWKGHSALDALEMTTFGINLLREHVRPTVRMHYVITGGGKVPNVVPENAKLWLWVRDSSRQGVKTVVKRIENIVEGAALATATKATIHYNGSYHEMLVNLAGSKVMQKNLEMVGPISYTQDEFAFAKRMQKEVGVEEKGVVCEVHELKEPAKDPEGGSTDVAEVSWITPTLHLSATTAPYGIPWHSWAVVASSRNSIGYKGMFMAAKVLAATAVDLYSSKEVLKAMTQEFKEKLGDYTYKSGIPEGQKPPVRTKKKS